MTYWELLYNYDLILVAIVGTYMAMKVLRQWSIQFLNRDPAKAGEKLKAIAEKTAAKLKKKQEKTEAALKKLSDKAEAAVDGVRDAIADKLEDTADAVRPDE